MIGTNLALASILIMLGIISLQIGALRDRTWLGGFVLRIIFAACCIVAALVILDAFSAQTTPI